MDDVDFSRGDLVVDHLPKGRPVKGAARRAFGIAEKTSKVMPASENRTFLR